MPGFNQLEEFEKDLFSLGKEVSIRRDRGEKAVVSQLPTSTYVEDDSEDFADGWPQEPPSFKTRSTTPHLDLEEEATKIANASDEASSQDEDASESEIIISKPVKLSEEDFDDIIDNLSFDNLDVLPDWNDLPTEEFFTTADETAADETDEFSADSDEIGDDDASISDETVADDGTDEFSADSETDETITEDESAADESGEIAEDDAFISDETVADDGTDESTTDSETDETIAEDESGEIAEDDAFISDEAVAEDETDETAADESDEIAEDDAFISDETVADDGTDESAADSETDETIAEDETAADETDETITEDESAADESGEIAEDDAFISDEAVADDETDESAADESDEIAEDESGEIAEDDAFISDEAVADDETDESAADSETDETIAEDDAFISDETVAKDETDESAADESDEIADDDAFISDEAVADDETGESAAEDESGEIADDDAFISDETVADDETDESAADSETDETIAADSDEIAEDDAFISDETVAEDETDELAEDESDELAEDDEDTNEEDGETPPKKQKVILNPEAENLVDKFTFISGDVAVRGKNTYVSTEPDYSEFFTKEKQEIFLRYLNRYPLNLRIATEKVLLKPDLPDRVIAEIFRLVLKKSTAAVLADYISNLSENYIEVPHNFEGRSNEAFDEYKGTLQYQIRNRLVPTVAAVVLIGLAGWLLAFFGNRFIYHPICATMNYKSGYALLETGAFPESEAKFSKAVSHWPSKKWFFKYAEGYRQKRQYEMAGKVFEAGMGYFPKDYNFGLKYAKMQLDDLGNYKLAENIVRRYVLDRFINLSEGVLLLGDIYLEWATELNEEEKFEDAYEQYSFLMAQEGQNDLTLSRMMRYFIRTDQLNNVLPIKNYFYEEETKKEKERLSPQDLSELGAYLLEKLYGEIAPKDEYLRGYIEDVKSILEKAVLANPADPEPQYNMSRYFIETENPSMAQAQLEIALRTFGNISTKNRRQLIQNIDSYRLLGELYRDSGEYLRAEEEFVKGINMYETESVYGNIPVNKNIGKLYSDLADLDYFISGDLDAALLNYQNSMKQGNITPSIQYRIGYIQYAHENYDLALLSFTDAVIETPRDTSVLLALANALHLRDNNFAAQGYYERLLEELTEEKNRRGVVLPQLRIDDAELADNYMRATNNYGVVMYNLAQETGNSEKIAKAMVNFAESARAWDAMTRNPDTLIRLPTGNLASQNSKYSVNPDGRFAPAIYMDIPRTLNGEKILKQ